MQEGVRADSVTHTVCSGGGGAGSRVTAALQRLQYTLAQRS